MVTQKAKGSYLQYDSVTLKKKIKQRGLLDEIVVLSSFPNYQLIASFAQFFSTCIRCVYSNLNTTLISFACSSVAKLPFTHSSLHPTIPPNPASTISVLSDSSIPSSSTEYGVLAARNERTSVNPALLADLVVVMEHN